MKLGFKRGQKGFTLIELMVVMAIMAILAAIVIPSVSGTKQVSLDSQVVQDATSVETAVNNFNTDSQLAELLTTTPRAVLSENTTQVTSSKWPELNITDNLTREFPTTIGTAENTVAAVIIKDDDGTTVLYQTGGTTGQKLADFVSAYNAADITTLVSSGYLQEKPNGFDATFSADKPYHNYLWLLKKTEVAYGGSGGRVVEVFCLTTISTATADTLTYQRIY